MEPKDLLQMYFERSIAVQTFWNFEVTIAFAIIAFFGSVRMTATRARLLATLFTIGYIGFVSVNLSGIHEVTEARLALQSILVSASRENPSKLPLPLISTVHPPQFWMMCAMHLFVDVIVISTVWYLARRPDQKQQV